MMSEFEQIHYAVFGSYPDNLGTLKDKYYKAVDELINRKNEAQISAKIVDLDNLLENNADLESIEYFIRKIAGPNTLTQRFHILTYLSESRSKYYDYFINEKSSIVKGFFILSFYFFRSIFKILKGCFLVRKYGIN